MPFRRNLRKLHDSIPKGDPNGIHFGETFVSFDELHEVCSALMDPANSAEVETHLGKMHYTKDPPYNLRRKK